MESAVIKVVKSGKDVTLEVFDDQGDKLVHVESETFADVYTLNFHLQTVASKLKIKRVTIVIHDVPKNTVDVSVAKGENSFFI